MAKIFLDRYKDFYDQCGINAIFFKGILWREYQKMVVPVGPIKYNYYVDKYDADCLLRQFKKSLLVRSHFGFNCLENTEWYAVICDSFQSLDNLPSSKRSEIKRGLKNCFIEKVDAEYISKKGYQIYYSAFKRYKNAKPLKEQDFKRQIEVSKNFDDIIHYWGVFEKVTGNLIGYSQNLVYDKVEVSYSSVKFEPNYLKLYSSYALFYKMNEYYLENQNVEYVNDGFRSILHETEIQNYLIKKFNFKIAFLKINVFYKPLVKYFIYCSYPFKKFLKNFSPKLDAIYRIEEIRRKNINYK